MWLTPLYTVNVKGYSRLGLSLVCHTGGTLLGASRNPFKHISSLRTLGLFIRFLEEPFTPTWSESTGCRAFKALFPNQLRFLRELQLVMGYLLGTSYCYCYYYYFYYY